MKLLWKIINNYKYKISNTGLIKNMKTKKILKPTLRNGYLACSLSKNNIKKTFSIHRLVADAFVKNPNIKKYVVVNHKDGNKKNNNADNLEWLTHSQNTKHAIKNKLVKIFNRKVIQYDLHGEQLNIFESIKKAADTLGISSKHISSVCLGKRKSCHGFIWKFFDKEELTKIKGKEYPYIKNYLITKDGKVYSKRSNKYLKPKKNSDGYLSLALSKNGLKKDYLVHRLVATVYIENPKKHKYVNHIDKNKSNNEVSNLEWCTARQNIKHHLHNSKNIHKVKVTQLSLKKKIIKIFDSIKEASIETNIDKSSIVRVCKGKQKSAGNYLWKYVV